MRLSTFAVLVATGLFLFGAEGARGQAPDVAVIDFTPGAQTALAAAQNDKVVGWQFKVVNLQPNERLKVVDLGYWIAGPAAVNVVQHPIKLWDDVGGPGGMPAVVAQSIVTAGRAPKQNGGPTSQWFRWRGLNQIAGGLLEPNKTYTIGAYYSRPAGMPMNPGDPWIVNPMNVQWDPHVSFVQDAFTNNNAGDVYPDQTNGMGSTPLFGPNFKFEVITVEGFAFCFGDGMDPNVTTACPCGNFGSPGNGCGNSVNPGGALLASSGTSSPDTIDFTVIDVPPGVGTIFLQGNSLISAGVVFGDGVRCAGGQLTRLGLKNDTDLDGSTSFGPSFGDPQISTVGFVVPGNTYHYQTYYRNPNALWCPPATFNISNGITIAWP